MECMWLIHSFALEDGVYDSLLCSQGQQSTPSGYNLRVVLMFSKASVVDMNIESYAIILITAWAV